MKRTETVQQDVTCTVHRDPTVGRRTLRLVLESAHDGVRTEFFLGVEALEAAVQGDLPWVFPDCYEVLVASIYGVTLTRVDLQCPRGQCGMRGTAPTWFLAVDPRRFASVLLTLARNGVKQHTLNLRKLRMPYPQPAAPLNVVQFVRRCRSDLRETVRVLAHWRRSLVPEQWAQAWE